MKNYLTPYFLCFANLLFMHYMVISTCAVECPLYLISFIDNIASIILEITVISLILFFFTKGRAKLSAAICFVVTLVWSFSNIMYSRFFHQYLSLSAFEQTGVLMDGLIIECIASEFEWIDIYFILSSILFVFILLKTKEKKLGYVYIKKHLSLVLFSIGLVLFSHLIYCFCNPAYRYLSFYVDHVYKKHIYTKSISIEPIYATFHRGSLRMLLTESLMNLSGPISLSEHQMRMIKNEIEDKTYKQNVSTLNLNIKNVIFILVESYMAFTSDLIVENKEVTPYLNSLKRDSTVYYNGNICPNITIGESSDGQFIYMSGLLPLRSMITVSKVAPNRIPGMADILKRNKGLQTRMIIPTSISMWKQDVMCQKYGFEDLYSSQDYANGDIDNLNDEQLFQLVKEIDVKKDNPFFSVILTMSMHQPYTEFIDDSFPISDTIYSESLKSYLNACHYTDKQIGRYLEFLKENDLFDNSLIVITSDHNVPSNAIVLSEDMDAQALPLYIINSGIARECLWQGDCNQLDVYTTVLDILGIKDEWMGLGHTLYNRNFQQSVTNDTWNISEWIILSDYFGL